MRHVQLLGPAGMSVDGHPGAIARGRKTWLLISRLLLDGSATRQQLAEFLVAEANDPLGALRWLLTDARRLLHGFAEIQGRTTVTCRLAPDVHVDALTLRHGTWIEAVALPRLGRPFLEGIPDDEGPLALQSWLQATRWSLQAAGESVLREAGLLYLGANRPGEALEHLHRLLEVNPFDEDGHVLAVRAMLAQGAIEAAHDHADKAFHSTAQQLGSEAAAVLRVSLDGALKSTEPKASVVAPSRASVQAALDAGRAAVHAGSVDDASLTLRAAVADSHIVGDFPLEARALLELGAALLDTARGREGEAAETLSSAVAAADACGSLKVAAEARVQLALRELMRGRYRRALRWIDEAEAIGNGGEADFAWARALCLLEMGQTSPALELFDQLVAEARDDETGLRRLLHRGRCLFVRGDTEHAEADLRAAMVLARRLGSVQSLPLAEALLAHLDITRGDLAEARELVSHADALAQRLKDPCWQEVSAAGRMRLAIAEGQACEAVELGAGVRSRSAGLSGGSVWFSAFCLDALCESALAAGDPRCTQWIYDLRVLSARCDMLTFLARAERYRLALGMSAADGSTVRSLLT